MQALTDPSRLLQIAEKLLTFERPLLVTLPVRATDRINRISKMRLVASGCAIAAAGALPATVILLIHGEAVIRTPGPGGAAVKRVRPGEILGIPESLCHSTGRYDIVAISDCRVAVLSGTRLERFLQKDREAREHLIDALGKGTQALYRSARLSDE